MKQIYNFENAVPPLVTEKKLAAELKHRELRRQTMILRIASVILSIAMVLFAFLVAPRSMPIAIAVICLFGISLIGNGIITVIFCRKGASLR